MWTLRALYFCGVGPDRLHRWYYGSAGPAAAASERGASAPVVLDGAPAGVAPPPPPARPLHAASQEHGRDREQEHDHEGRPEPAVGVGAEPPNRALLHDEPHQHAPDQKSARRPMARRPLSVRGARKSRVHPRAPSAIAQEGLTRVTRRGSRRTKRRSMRSLSRQAKREWLTIPCQRSRALPSAVLRSDRKVRCGTYARGSPPSQRRAKVPRQHRSLADRVHARLRRRRVVRQRHAVTRAPDGRAIRRPKRGVRRAGSPGRSSGRPGLREEGGARGAGEPDDQIRRDARPVRELDGVSLPPGSTALPSATATPRPARMPAARRRAGAS